MNDFSLELPINNLSFGSTSIMFLKKLKERGYNPPIFPIGNLDLSAQQPDQEFNTWLQENINTAIKRHKRSNKVFKLWHLSDGIKSFSEKQVLFSFHECSALTPEEGNTISNNYKVLVSSKYTKQIFEDHTGGNNIIYCPLAFDSYNFHKTNKNYLRDSICWFLGGKYEARKNTARIVKNWIKRWGNNKGHMLNLTITNPFFRNQDGSPMDFHQQKQMFIQNVLDGKNYWNVNFLPFLPRNAEFNDALNCSDIDLTGLSRLEGFNLPFFHSLCLGKWGIALNAHVHKDYCDESNSILVQPKGMVPAEDVNFFKRGLPFNQGFWFDWDDDEMIAAMERAVSKAKTPNLKGENLKEIFTIDRMTDAILKELNE